MAEALQMGRKHCRHVEPCLENKSLENTVGKGKIAPNEQFLLFLKVFSSRLENFLSFSSNLKTVTCKLCQFGRV